MKYILYNRNFMYNNLPSGIVDLVITSPPYDDIRNYKCLWNFDIFCKIANELYRIIKNGGVIVWIVGDQIINNSESGNSFKQVLYFKSLGLNIHDTMIYQKDSPAQASNKKSSRYTQIFEYMFVLSKGKPKTVNLIKDRKNKYTGVKTNSTRRLKNGKIIKDRIYYIDEYGYRNNIWKYGCGYMKSTKDDIAYKHPAIFPENLVKDHIITWSNEHDIILDPFSGSGTTLKIAYMLNRKSIGYEINKNYCEIINERMFYTKMNKEQIFFIPDYENSLFADINNA